MLHEKVMKVAARSAPYKSQIGASLLAGLAQIAHAQTPAESVPNASPAAPLENNGNSLEMIIVTAQKRSERLQDVPVRRRWSTSSTVP